MLSYNYVIVLGAGASADYKFPTGRQLINEVAQRLSLEYPTWGPILERMGFGEPSLCSFRERLVRADPPSIDAFLLNNPNDTKLGKAATALALIQHETMESIGWAPDKKLYTYIYYKMGVQPGEFISSANRLTIVTFNYDRSLEFYLYQSLTNLFGNDQVAKSFIRDKIIHVYGILGTPDFLAKDGRPFEPICNEENIKKCIDSMWMITEAESNPIRFDDTHHPIGAADVVCFLGFGYSRENIRRLNIKQSWFKEKRFYGSAYGLAADDIEAINRFSDSSIRLGPTNEKAIEFMQNQSVLR